MDHLRARGRITSSIWEPFFDVDFTIKARLEGTEAGRRDDIQQRCARLERFRRYLLNAAGRIGLYLQQALTSGQGRNCAKIQRRYWAISTISVQD